MRQRREERGESKGRGEAGKGREEQGEVRSDDNEEERSRGRLSLSHWFPKRRNADFCC